MKGLCNVCNKERKIFYNGMCQCCYKKQTKKYNNWKEKEGIKYTNKTHRKIVKMFLKNKIPKEDIADYFDMTIRNVNIIIKKYCCRCDEDGNVKS